MIKGRLVNIRPAEEDDIETIIPWTLDPELCRLLYGSLLSSKLEQSVFLQDLIRQRRLNFPFAMLFIIEAASGFPIGFLNLHSINWRSGSLMNDMAIADPDYRGKGAAIEVIALTLNFVFKELNMNKLAGNIHDFNKASLSLYRKCAVFGIEQEGTLRKHVFRNGGYHDSHVFSLLRKDYEENEGLLNKLILQGKQ